MFVIVATLVGGIALWRSSSSGDEYGTDKGRQEQKSDAQVLQQTQLQQTSRLITQYGKSAAVYVQKVNSCPQASCQIRMARQLRDSLQQLRMLQERLQATERYNAECENN